MDAAQLLIGVLAFAIGIFASHATLGNKITRALTLLEGLPALERRITALEAIVPHFHVRSSDL